jgi:DnaJ family protein A protein 5
MAAVDGPQRCLYEILGIEQASTDSEIRAAYRMLALKIHPDKAVQSGISQEEANARFQEIVGAYKVLSDPHARSLYDSQRSKTHYSSASSPSAKNCDFHINLSPYFCTSIFSGYGDTGKGFFRVYADIFQKLFQQEIAYAHSTGTGHVLEAPLIGNLKSPYAQVSAFYNYWLGFSTVKDFSWVDKYRVSAERNRKAKRLLEEENKKLRKAAKRKYNETVRQLAQFVRKRDKRVLERQSQRNKEEEEKEKAAQATLWREKLEKEKLERERHSEEQKRERERQSEEQKWESVDGHDRNGGSDHGYCSICNKKFISDIALFYNISICSRQCFHIHQLIPET